MFNFLILHLKGEAEKCEKKKKNKENGSASKKSIKCKSNSQKKAEETSKKGGAKCTTPRTPCPPAIPKVSKTQKSLKRKFHEDQCSTCDGYGPLMVCEMKTCSKAYHEDCIPTDFAPVKKSK